MLLLAMFACLRLFQVTRSAAVFKLLEMDVPRAAMWAAGVFIISGAVIFLLTVGPNTGIKGIDDRVHKLIDLLIETESELTKVSWPGRDELTRSTTAVLISILLLGVFLFVVDRLLMFVMSSLRVLPG